MADETMPEAAAKSVTTPMKLEVIGNKVAVEFQIEELIRRVLPIAAGHCSGCIGCSGCKN